MLFEEAVTYMEKSAARGSILGLTRIKSLLAGLGNPEQNLKCIHVTGTNGKGSTSCFIAGILREAGYVTGQYYSPALESCIDHFRINGVLISEKDYADAVEKLMAANECVNDELGEYATQFELETALAFYWFDAKGCDIAVIEVGLGGRDDATNVIAQKELCVAASVSYDHMAVLGDTLAEIADVKSGIITTDCPVVIMDSGDEVDRVFEDRAKLMGSSFTVVRKEDILWYEERAQKGIFTYKDLKDLKINIAGSFQRENAALAAASAKILANRGWNISEENIRAGLLKAKWPYRFDKIIPGYDIYLDGAHNENASVRLKETILEELPHRRIILVLGMFKDKEYEKVIGNLAGLAASVYTLTVPLKERALDSFAVSRAAEKYCDDTTACMSIHECAGRALEEYLRLSGEETKDKPALVACGSLSYLCLFKEEISGLLRVSNIMHDDEYLSHISNIKELEKDRIYCRHNMDHFMRTADIALGLSKEKGLDHKWDVIMAAALLHDVGRDVQAKEKIPHELAGKDISYGILKRAGYSDNEAETISEAIGEHGNEESMKRCDLAGLLYRADKLSRDCFICEHTDTCKKALYKRNMLVK